MVPYEAALEALKQQTLSVPWIDGFLIGFTMLLWGFVATIGDRAASLRSTRLLGKILLGATVIRYSQSYSVYKHGLLEGLWPLLWTIALVAGIAMASRNPRANPDG